MKILFLLSEFPYPPSNGTRCKPLNLLRGLSLRHQCDVLCFGNAHDATQIAGLLQACPGVSMLGIIPQLKWGLSSQIRGLISNGLPSSGVYTSELFRNAVRKALTAADYDVVHIDTINLVQYADLVGEVPLVISPNDAVSMGYKNRTGDVRGIARIRDAVAWRLIRRYERRAYQHRAVHVVSEADRGYLERLIPTASIEVIKLPVESTYMINAPANLSEEVTVAIPANFGAPGLADRILEIFEFMSKKIQFFPMTKFRLVGGAGPEAFVDRLRGWQNVEYCGWVPDFCAALSTAHIVMFPERGGAGTKNRALQSMALGKPIVVSPSAAAGLSGKHRKEFLVCATPSEFASALELLIRDQSLARSIGSAGQRMVVREHSSNNISERWEHLYLRLAIGKESSYDVPAAVVRNGVPDQPGMREH